MLQQLKKRNSGFTIIEVLIVLAIAGLIMVVVFLAVPNLQRNQRNNGTKTEANNLLAAYSEISDQKNGTVLSNSVSSTAGSDAAAVKSAANTNTITTVTIQSTAPTLGTTKAATSSATIVTGYSCASDPTVAPVASTARSVALVYTIETSSGVVSQCIGS